MSPPSDVFCREDFFRKYGTKCAGCQEGIAPSSVVGVVSFQTFANAVHNLWFLSQVRRAQEHVYHVDCFQCILCTRKLVSSRSRENQSWFEIWKILVKSKYCWGENPTFHRYTNTFRTLTFSGHIVSPINTFRTLGMSFTWWRTRSFCARQITTVQKQKVSKESIWENLFFWHTIINGINSRQIILKIYELYLAADYGEGDGNKRPRTTITARQMEVFRIKLSLGNLVEYELNVLALLYPR